MECEIYSSNFVFNTRGISYRTSEFEKTCLQTSPLTLKLSSPSFCGKILHLLIKHRKVSTFEKYFEKFDIGRGLNEYWINEILKTKNEKMISFIIRRSIYFNIDVEKVISEYHYNAMKFAQRGFIDRYVLFEAYKKNNLLLKSKVFIDMWKNVKSDRQILRIGLREYIYNEAFNYESLSDSEIMFVLNEFCDDIDRYRYKDLFDFAIVFYNNGKKGPAKYLAQIAQRKKNERKKLIRKILS